VIPGASSATTTYHSHGRALSSCSTTTTDRVACCTRQKNNTRPAACVGPPESDAPAQLPGISDVVVVIASLPLHSSALISFAPLEPTNNGSRCAAAAKDHVRRSPSPPASAPASPARDGPPAARLRRAGRTRGVPASRAAPAPATAVPPPRDGRLGAVVRRRRGNSGAALRRARAQRRGRGRRQRGRRRGRLQVHPHRDHRREGTRVVLCRPVPVCLIWVLG
jgi:hypothetical protein